jgi:predicted TIM-barrel fold metal-dependent hydrolase
VPLLPDPEPRARRFPVISVDDHLIEPPDLFEGRMPAHLVDVAPRLVEFENGKQAWAYEDKLFPNIGLNAVIGRPKDEWTMDPARFDEMRKGCWDIHARIADMDVAGIWASLCFPSLIAGFAGVAFAKSKDEALGLACVRAWNDWHHDVWAGTYPERMIPLQLVWLRDPEIAADDVRRNADRGFKAITFPESMNNLGLPSVHTDHWDPLLRACEETGTVVCMHTGSGQIAPPTSPESPLEQSTSLSEGGIGWVPMFLDRLDYIMEHSASGMANAWDDGSASSEDTLTPSEAVRRNFWFCSIDDPTTLRVRDRIGVEHIMVESDYPHADSSWPDTQRLLAERLADLPAADVAKLTHENAARLFRHPLPADGWLTGTASEE